MADHEGLIAAFTIIGVWAFVFFQVLGLPELSPPVNYEVDVAQTTGFVLFSAIYVLRRRQFRPIGAKRVILKSGGSIALVILTALSFYESEFVFYGIRDFSSLGIDLLKFVGLAFAGGSCLVALIFLNGWQRYLRGYLKGANVQAPSHPTPKVRVPRGVPEFLRSDLEQKLTDVQLATEPRTKKYALEKLRSPLSDFAHSSAEWEPDDRARMEAVLQLTYEEFEDFKEICLDYLALMVNSLDPRLVELMKEQFSDRISSLGRDSTFDENHNLLHLLVWLSESREQAIKDLLHDAIYDWLPPKWTSLRPALSNEVRLFQNKNQEDLALYSRLRTYMFNEMNKAEKEGKEGARDRAQQLLIGIWGA